MEHKEDKSLLAITPGLAASQPLMAPSATNASAEELNGRLAHADPKNIGLAQDEAFAEVHRADPANLYDFSPMAYFVLDHRGHIRDVNISGANSLKTARASLIGRNLADFATLDTQAAYGAFLKQIFSSGTKETCDLSFVDAEKNTFFAHVEANVDVERQFCRMVMCDVSERREAELALIQSEERFRLMADSAPVLIWITGADLQYIWFNKMWLDFTGRSLEQERDKGWAEGIHPDDRATCQNIQSSAFETRSPFSMEYRLRSRDGHYHYVLAHGVPRTSPSGRFLGYIGSCTDISERKKVEEALRHSRQMLRHLVSYQERVREDERKRIAREIHDDLGQNLLALRIDVSMLHARTGESHPKLHHRVGLALNHIDATMKAVRAAINNLRPTVLDLGLNAAIEWQVNDFERRSGISCELSMEEDVAVDDDRATALFRILQESLNNVIRHAQANRVRIDLYRDSDKIVMMIADDGIGLYPDCRRKANSFGLVGIQERINALGGELDIDSNAHRGTMLIISLPLA